MAASSSSSSAAPKIYDVFISFRRAGGIHYDFTSHLVKALSRNSIRHYIYYEFKETDEISPAVIKAIHDSYGSIIVFSENYASSKCCLDELVQILECREQGHFVIPVFYNTDPSCVRKQTARYGQEFAIHKRDSRSKEKLQSWKAALTEAANIVGWDTRSPANRDESKLIGNIINDILQKIDHIYQIKESRFVGIDNRYYKDIESLLERSSVVGIWGMGGVGKTTIAKVVFDKLFYQYDYSYFFENVREESKRNIPEKLLFGLLEGENFPNSTPEAPALKYAMRRLSGKKVLIVLDDVDNSKQLEYLQQECNCFSVDSKIIITTRDKHLVNGFKVCHEVYEVRELDYEKSLQFFRLYAFNGSYPKIGYEEITEKFVDYARGIPLALKVLGCFLHSKSKKEWEGALEKLSKIPNDDIQKVLRLSYDGLNYVKKQMFLDIACFLKGELVENVITLTGSFDFYEDLKIRRMLQLMALGIKTFQDKALVSIYDRRVQMHDLIQEIGRHIDCEVSINGPGEHSRLWDPEEIYYVLKNNKGTNRIRAITLDMSKIKDLPLETNAFKKMTNLRFLKFYVSNCAKAKAKSSRRYDPGCLELSSDKLSYFHWEFFPFHSFSSNFCVVKLVVLCMPFGKMTKLWDGLQRVVNLKEIILYECRQLMELPDLSEASKLERVDLSWCTRLCHIHPSLLHFFKLTTLIELRLTASNVESLPTSIKHLPCLKHLDVSHCWRLRSLPELPPSTIDLDARNCQMLEKLNPSTRLEQCYLEDCVKLDQRSIDGIMAAVRYRIKQAEPIRVGLPGDRVPRWFRYSTRQNRISTELPPRSDLLGFAFYCIVSCTILDVATVCYLEDSAGKEFTGEWGRYYHHESFINEHTYLWYDHRISDSLNAMEGRAHGRVSFRLVTAEASHVGLCELTALKGFGVWPIYASELELGDKCKTLCYEPEVDDQLQLSLTKKFKNLLRNLF